MPCVVGEQADVSRGHPPPRLKNGGCRVFPTWRGGWWEARRWVGSVCRATGALLSPQPGAPSPARFPEAALGQLGAGEAEEAPTAQEQEDPGTPSPGWLPTAVQPGSAPPSRQGLEDLLSENMDLVRKTTLGY